jgi:hypothetical protein
VTQVLVYPGAIEVLPTGQPFQMVAVALNGCGDPVSGINFSWRSSNEPVAIVTGSGVVRGLQSGGSTTISATATGLNKGNQAPSAAAPGQSIVQFADGTTDDRTISRVTMYPPNPSVAEGFQQQMSGLAFNRFNQVVPDVRLSWTSTQSSIAGIVNSTSGLISGNAPGIATIRVAPTSSGAFGSTPSTTFVVRAVNGGAVPDPEVVVTTTTAVIVAGEKSRIFAWLRNPETLEVTPATFTWRASVAGVVSLVPSLETDFVDITGQAPGNVTVTATAVANGITYVGPPILVRVLTHDPSVSSEWTSAAPLPIATVGMGLSVSGDHLVITGGVTGSNFTGGPREQVMRARMHHTGPLFKSDFSSGWDISQSGDVTQLLVPCTTDPACMTIYRNDPGLAPEFVRDVRYQVFGHGQVATDTHVYVIGGIDAQVDLGAVDPASTGATGPNGIGAVGPNDTRFSDRVLIAPVGPFGSLTGWIEGPRLPQVGLSNGDTDIPGSYAPGVALYRDWIYVTGGWGASIKTLSGQIVGRNRDEVFRAKIQPDGSLDPWQILLDRLPQPLNKHGAAVVDVVDSLSGATRSYIVISGGSTGADQFSPDSISDQVVYAQLDPLTGDFITTWAVGSVLPRALEFHAMVNIPGTDMLMVTGGDDILTSNRESYLIHVNFSNGVAGNWTRLPLLPNLGGVTALSAVGVGQVAGQPVKRVYVAGGGALATGSDFELTRSKAVYFIDIN